MRSKSVLLPLAVDPVSSSGILLHSMSLRNQVTRTTPASLAEHQVKVMFCPPVRRSPKLTKTFEPSGCVAENGLCIIEGFSAGDVICRKSLECKTRGLTSEAF